MILVTYTYYCIILLINNLRFKMEWANVSFWNYGTEPDDCLRFRKRSCFFNQKYDLKAKNER